MTGPFLWGCVLCLPKIQLLPKENAGVNVMSMCGSTSIISVVVSASLCRHQQWHGNCIQPQHRWPTGPLAPYPGPTSLYKPRPAPGRQLPWVTELSRCCCSVWPRGPETAVRLRPPPHQVVWQLCAGYCALVDKGCGAVVFSPWAALLVAVLENQFSFIVNNNTEMARWIHIIYFIFR